MGSHPVVTTTAKSNHQRERESDVTHQNLHKCWRNHFLPVVEVLRLWREVLGALVASPFFWTSSPPLLTCSPTHTPAYHVAHTGNPVWVLWSCARFLTCWGLERPSLWTYVCGTEPACSVEERQLSGLRTCPHTPQYLSSSFIYLFHWFVLS